MMGDLACRAYVGAGRPGHGHWSPERGAAWGKHLPRLVDGWGLVSAAWVGLDSSYHQPVPFLYSILKNN